MSFIKNIHLVEPVMEMNAKFQRAIFAGSPRIFNEIQKRTIQNGGFTHLSLNPEQPATASLFLNSVAIIKRRNLGISLALETIIPSQPKGCTVQMRILVNEDDGTLAKNVVECSFDDNLKPSFCIHAPANHIGWLFAYFEAPSMHEQNEHGVTVSEAIALTTVRELAKIAEPTFFGK